MDNQQRDGARSGRYVPFNLTTVAPFEATAQALRELPVLRTVSPSNAQDAHPNIPDNRYSPSAEVQARMVEMMSETAFQGSWHLQPDEFSLATADVPGWVSDACRNLCNMSIEEVSVVPASRKPIAKRPRIPAATAYNRTQSREDPLHLSRDEPAADPSYCPSREARSYNIIETDDHVELRKDKAAAEIADSFRDENFRRFVDCLKRFIAKGRHGGDSLTSNPKLLSEIRQNVSIHMQNGLLHNVPPHLLRDLMDALAVRVRYTCERCKAGDSSMREPGFVSESTLAMQCAIFILSIFAAPKVSRTVLVEERLDETCALLELISANVVYPSVDPLYQASRRTVSNKPNGSLGSSQQGRRDDEGDWNLRHGARSTTVSKKMQNLIVFCAEMYDLLGGLVRDKRLSENLAFKLSSLGTRSLRISSIPIINSCAVSFVATVYACHPRLGINILNDLFDEVSFVPPARKHLRTYRVIGTETTCIRASSAMSMYIVQVAASRPDNEKNGDEKNKESGRLLSGFNYGTKFAMYLVHRILSRVFQERDSEYRVAVQSFLDDIMKMYGVPEWPAADIILNSISVQTVNKLETSGKGKLSAQARALAMDYLGALSSKLSSLFTPDVLQSSISSEESHVDPSTEENERIRLLRYFQEDSNFEQKEHPSRRLWESMFSADDFNNGGKQRNVRQQKPTEDSDDGSLRDVSDDESNREGRGHEDTSRQFAQEQLLSRLESVSLARRSGELVTRQDALHSCHIIVSRRGLARGFNTILKAILSGLYDPAPTVRAKAVRGLSHLQFDKTTTMHHFPEIFARMEDGSRDVSTLVRDGALDFLGRFLTLETGERYLQMKASAQDGKSTVGNVFVKVFSIVEKRLKDRAVSVRKRAINIFRKLAEESVIPKDENDIDDDGIGGDTAHHERENLVVTICTSLVGRLDDPETSVREVAEKTVRFSLFGIDYGETVKHSHLEEYAKRSSRRLISLFRRLPWNSQPSFLDRIVNKEMRKNNIGLLVAIARATVDRLHELESCLANGEASDTPADVERNRRVYQPYDQQRVACASILSGFCIVQPSLVAPHCASLAPSLTGFVERRASENDIMCIHRILKVLECSIPHVEGLEPEFLQEIMHDVEVIVCQYPRATLEEPSIRCFCALALYTDTAESKELLMTTANNFLGFISDQLPAFTDLSMGHRNSSSPGLERNARGALVRLSLLLRYGEYEPDFVKEVYNGLKKTCSVFLSGWSDQTLNCLGSPALLRASVRALIHFLIRHRSFLPLGTATILECSTKALRRMDKFQNDKYAAEVLLTVLQGFHEMLRNEEERNSAPRENESPTKTHGQTSNDERTRGDTKGPSLAAEEDAEAGYLAVCAQSLLSALSDAATNHEIAVRRCVANVLGLLTRQGLVLPATIVSPLFSLMIDADVKCREDSYRVVAFIADRHSSMLASAALPAIRNCFQKTSLRLGRAGDSNVIERITASIVDVKSGYTLLSPALVLLSRDYRQGILTGLLREFDPCVTARVKARKFGVNSTDTETVLDGSGLGESLTTDVAHDDDDILNEGSPELELYGSKKLCPVSTLVFVTITLACLDYSSGAGLGGSLKQSGGTAAADAKLKAGRDDITEMCAMATRIISNSGQAVLRVAVQRMREGNFGLQEKRIIADHSTRLSLLLRLKNHLVSLRSSGNQHTGEADGEQDVDKQRIAPAFSFGELALTAGPLCRDSLIPQGADGDIMKQIILFRRMMHDDAIEASDIALKQSRGVKGSRRASRSGKRPRSKREGPSSGRVKKAKRRRSDRPPRARLVYGDEEDGSDYVPPS